RTADECVSQRLPVVEARGSCESVIHRPLVGMSELVGLEWIAVHDPAAVQVASDRREVTVVVAVEWPVDEVYEDIEADDLERGDEIAFSRLDRGRSIELQWFRGAHRGLGRQSRPRFGQVRYDGFFGHRRMRPSRDP